MNFPPPEPSSDLLLQRERWVYELRAEYFEGQIDIKAFRARCPHYPVLSSNPLVVEPERGRWIFLEKFGAVVFWNCTEPIMESVREELAALPGLGGRVEQAHDRLVVQVGAEADRVSFSTVALKELSLDRLKIVSLALAQSVALDHFEGSVSRAMARVQPMVNTLQAQGRLAPPRREVLSTVGFVMQVRAAVLQNLTLFDDPPETWESEALAHLDSALFDQFDLEERLSAIEQKLAYLQDAGATFLELLNTRKALRLEWIVIILIAAEILLGLLQVLKH